MIHGNDNVYGSLNKDMDPSSLWDGDYVDSAGDVNFTVHTLTVSSDDVATELRYAITVSPMDMSKPVVMSLSEFHSFMEGLKNCTPGSELEAAFALARAVEMMWRTHPQIRVVLKQLR